MKPKSRHRAKYPKAFPLKPSKPLTAKTLARRIAREDERADRHTAGLPPLKAPKPKISPKSQADCREALVSSFAAIARVTDKLTSSDTRVLLRALATLQSGRFADLTPDGDIVIFAEEWDRAFNPRIEALLMAYYRASQGPLPSSLPRAFNPTASKPLTAKTLARRAALGSFLDDWEAKHGELTPDELAAGLLPLKAPKPRRSPQSHSMRKSIRESIASSMRAIRRVNRSPAKAR